MRNLLDGNFEGRIFAVNPKYPTIMGRDTYAVESASGPGEKRLAIRPYPQELEESCSLNNGRKVLLRPIKPEDESAHFAFFKKLDPVDVSFRFFCAVGEIDHAFLARYTQIDYDRVMAFIATAMQDGRSETLGVVRAVSDADNIEAECAIKESCS